MEVFQNGWEDVTLEEYNDIIKIQQENNGYLSRTLETLCYLTDDDGWDDMPSQKVIQEYLKIKWVETPPMNNVIEHIGNYKLKPLNKLNLSEWIDLDDSIVNGEYSNIVSILYRKYEVDKWGNIEFEPYKFSLKERQEFSNNLPITTVIGTINSAYKYRETILSSFAELFEGYDDEVLNEEEKEMLSPSEVKEIENQIKNDNLKKNFAWQHLLDDISGGVWSHIPAILELPHTFVFNMRLAKKIYS